MTRGPISSTRLTQPTLTRPVIRPDFQEEHWGPPSGLADPELRLAVHNLQADLQSLLIDLARGPVEQLAMEGRRFLGEVRREFLRHHRRLVVGAKSDDLDPSSIRVETGELASHLRSVTLARSARLRAERWAPAELLQAARTAVNNQPQLLSALYEPKTFERQPGDGPLTIARRALLRTERRRADKRGTKMTRPVRLRALARYTIVGNLAHRLEGLAVLFVQADAQLAARTNHLLEHIIAGYRTLVRRSEDPDYSELVHELRSSVEAELRLTEEGLDQLCHDILSRAARSLGDGMVALKRELATAGTLDAGPVYEPRTQSAEEDAELARLQPKLDKATEAVAGGYVHLSMVLDFRAFNARVRARTQVAFSELSAKVRGRSSRQIERVLEALDAALKELGAPEEEHSSENERDLRATLAPVERVLSEARRTSEQLQEHLQAERAVNPILDALRRESDALTEHYAIPSGRLSHSEWTLPVVPPTVEVELARLVLSFIDSDVAPELLSVTAEGGAKVEPVLEAFEGLERVLSFDPAQVDELGAGADLQVVITGALGRSRGQLVALSEQTEALAEEMSLRMRQALRSKLTAFGERLERAQLTRAPVERVRQSRVRGWSTASLAAARRRAEELKASLRRWMGDERVHRLRRWLGLFPAEPPPWDPARVASPAPPDQLPLVYGRLFSSQAHWAAELVRVNEDLVEQARASLGRRTQGSLRCVAVVGVDGSGRGSLLTAIQRADRWKKILRLNFSQPVQAEDLRAQLAELTQEQLVVVSGLFWTYSARPGGARALSALLELILQDDGRNAWLIELDEQVFTQISQRSVMADVFSTVLRLGPLPEEELSRAVLGRHQLSGHALSFEAGGHQEDASGDPRGTAGPLQTRYFKELHAASGGLVRVALSMWVASVRRVDEEAGLVVIGGVPNPPRQALGRLSEVDLLLLFQVARQGWMDPPTFASLNRSTLAEGRAALSRLVGMGLLERQGKSIVQIRRHLRGELSRVFSQRGWTT